MSEEEHKAEEQEQEEGEEQGSATCQRFVMEGGVRKAVPFKSKARKQQQPKAKPVKTTYQSEFASKPKNKYGQEIGPYDPNAPRSTRPEKVQSDVSRTSPNASSISFENPNHPTKPKEQFSTTYSATIAGSPTTTKKK